MAATCTRYLSDEDLMALIAYLRSQPPMPWKAIGRMDDVERSAMYQYLLTLL